MRWFDLPFSKRMDLAAATARSIIGRDAELLRALGEDDLVVDEIVAARTRQVEYAVEFSDMHFLSDLLTRWRDEFERVMWQATGDPEPPSPLRDVRLGVLQYRMNEWLAVDGRSQRKLAVAAGLNPAQVNRALRAAEINADVAAKIEAVIGA